MTDDISLIAGGQTISGWSEVRVTRGIERCPSDFDIAFTEHFPDQPTDVIVKPGDACQIKLGSDLVLTGYVDRFMPSITARAHTVRITGRGKCQDLLDCSAEWPGSQISGNSVLGIAQKLAQPYGISVTADVPTTITIPQFNFVHGESAYEVIERLCRGTGGNFLAYDQPDGSLKLSQAGNGRAGSGFSQGVNVQAANAVYSMDQRFSDIYCYLQGLDVLGDSGTAGSQYSNQSDPGVPRHRRLDIIAESGNGGQDLTKRRALWEVARRGGRAFQLTVTCDSWRDAAGKLWEPNTLAPISLPILKTPALDWIISDVTYRRDAGGTTAEIVLMPQNAFLPEPFLLQPTPPDPLTGG